MAGIAAIPNSGKPKALIYTPVGRDAWVARSLVDEAGLVSIAATDLPVFASSLSDDVALGVLTEEAVRSSDLKPIAAWVSAQPSWSDLPFIVLTTRGGGPERNPAAARLSEVLGNVTFLERPFHDQFKGSSGFGEGRNCRQRFGSSRHFLSEAGLGRTRPK